MKSVPNTYFSSARKECSSFSALVVCVALGLFVGACASKKAVTAAPTSLVWPAPPVPPRIAYVQSIARPSDVGIKRPALARFASWITGSERGNEALVKPFGVAVDEEGNLYVTDTGANAICLFDRVRRKWQRWEKIGKTQFASPVAITARKGVIFVADSGSGRVVAFDLRGKLLFDITNRLERPSGLVIASDRLWVADSQRHCVASFDLGGNFLSEFGHRGAGLGEFNFPTHIAADIAGNLFVTDSLNGRVQMFGPNGEPRRQIGNVGDTSGSFSRPKGLALDTMGHVYVVDALFDNIQVFDTDGRFLLYLGEPGAKPGEFWLPNGIAISSNNDIFVADSYNRRVQVFKYIGQP